MRFSQYAMAIVMILAFYLIGMFSVAVAAILMVAWYGLDILVDAIKKEKE